MRYDVKITLTQVHTLAVDADAPEDAYEKAWNEIGNRKAERWDASTEVEKGVSGEQ